MKRFLLCAALCAWSALPTLAQNPVNNPNQTNSGIFQLPPSVQNVVSIDAQNLLIIASQNNGQTAYTPLLIQHVYSGGIARLFGGSVVPTAQFATPGLLNGNTQNGQTGVTTFGGNGGGVGNGANFGGGGNFGGGFGNGGFTNGVFNGTRAANSGVTNLQIRPR